MRNKDPRQIISELIEKEGEDQTLFVMTCMHVQNNASQIISQLRPEDRYYIAEGMDDIYYISRREYQTDESMIFHSMLLYLSKQLLKFEKNIEIKKSQFPEILTENCEIFRDNLVVNVCRLYQQLRS